MSEKSASVVFFSGVFCPVADKPQYDYTATVEVEVLPEAPEGFAEFFTQVNMVSKMDKFLNPYNHEDLPRWDYIPYDDICTVIYRYSQYFSYKVHKASVDADEVKLDDLHDILFHWQSLAGTSYVQPGKTIDTEE